MGSYVNRDPSLTKVADNYWILEYLTTDESTGEKLGQTHMEGDLGSLVLKLVAAHRSAWNLARRNERRFVKERVANVQEAIQEKEKENAVNPGSTERLGGIESLKG